MGWKLSAALAAVLLVAAVGGAALGSNARPAPIPDPRGLALQSADLPAFRSLAGAQGNSEPCPDGIGVLNSDRPRERCDMTSYVITAALSGTGRTQLDATARAEGNRTETSTLPELPLHGPFVTSHAGIFEVSDVVWLFGSEHDARSRFALDSDERDDPQSGYVNMPSSLGDESYRYGEPAGVTSDGTAFESRIITIWRRGRAVALLSTAGSANMSAAQHERLARIIDERLRVFEGR